MSGRGLAEIANKGGLGQRLVDVAITNVVGGKLNDGARLDGSARGDVMTDAGGHRTQRLSVTIVVGIDEPDGQLGPHFDHEAAHLFDLFWAQRQLFIHVGTDDAVGMVPGVVHTALNQGAEPIFRQAGVDIGLAETGRNAGQHSIAQAGIQSAQRPGVNVLVAPALVTDDRIAFDADERCDIAQLPHFSGHFIGDKLAIGENLKVAIGMLSEEIEQLRMHEWLASEHAKKGIAARLGLIDEAVQVSEWQGHPRFVDINPAPLAAEIARVEDGDVEEGRKVLPGGHPFLKELDGARPFHSKIPRDFPPRERIGGGENT